MRICILTWFLLSVAVAGQQLPLQRFPSVQSIAESDDRDMVRLAKPYGTPWLIFEPEEVQVRGSWHARIYLQPDAVDVPVRRGRLLLISARTAPDHSGPKPWQVTESAYVQVPTGVPGSLSRTAKDLPILERHRLPDVDLLSLVAFVRSSPSAPQRSNSAGPLYRINGEMPIQSIRRGEGSDIEVTVMRDRSASWILTVRPDAAGWRAVSVSFVIA